MTSGLPPLLHPKRYDEPTQFQVENLLREARRQRHLPDVPVPEVCLLDPDGDDGLDEPVMRGASWTTDAPLRETATAIAAAKAASIHAVEMEAAALYAYATARHRDVVCIAHVTNTMAAHGDDFEKGDDNGTHRVLAVVDAIAQRWSREHA